jgi:hypothetical protein
VTPTQHRFLLRFFCALRLKDTILDKQLRAVSARLSSPIHSPPRFLSSCFLSSVNDSSPNLACVRLNFSRSISSYLPCCVIVSLRRDPTFTWKSHLCSPHHRVFLSIHCSFLRSSFTTYAPMMCHIRICPWISPNSSQVLRSYRLFSFHTISVLSDLRPNKDLRTKRLEQIMVRVVPHRSAAVWKRRQKTRKSRSCAHTHTAHEEP